MKKGLLVSIIVIMMLVMPFIFASCSLSCDGDEVNSGANQISRKEPTCTDQGYIEYECVRSGASHYKFLSPTGHKNIVWVTDMDATCTTDGVEHKECSDCGVIFESRIVKRTGHKMGDWITDLMPTCTTEGTKHRVCINCYDVSEDGIVPALGHNVSGVDWEITVHENCTENGSQHKICKTCNQPCVVEVRPAKGHDLPLHYTILERETCTSDGLEAQICYDCDAPCNPRVRTMLGHNPKWGVVIAATCTTDGVMSNNCTRCDECFETKSVPATGHSRKLYTDKRATCTEVGFGHYGCPGCGERYESVAFDALGHDILRGECTRCEVFERTIYVSYIGDGAFELPAPYSFVMLNDELFEVDVPDFAGYFPIEHVVDNVTEVFVTVTYLVDGTEVVISADNSTTVNVGYGTSFTDLRLPTSVTGYTENGLEIALNVAWDESTYVATKAGTQTILGTLSLPEGADGYYLNVFTVVATVNVFDAIVRIDGIDLGIVDYHTHFTSLGLPTLVTAYTQQGTKLQVEVDWTAESYDALAIGRQLIIGVIRPVDGYYLQMSVVTASLVVAHTVTSSDSIDLGVVIYGTEFDDLTLPRFVTVHTRYGTTTTLGVVWDAADYSADKLGTQTISGSIVGVDGYVLNGVGATLTLTVKKEIVAIEEVVLGEVAVGTDFAELGLPATVTVTTNDGQQVNVYVIWNVNSYNSTEEGFNTLTGNIVLKSDLYIEDTTITAAYKIV